MMRALLLGYDPETVDYSDPALPPGMTAEKIHAGINAVHKAAPGAAIAFNTRPDDSADAAARWLAAGRQAV